MREMAAWLEGRGYRGDQAEAVVTRLVDAGELDDERFAQRYAEDKRELAGWGAERIREALMARGVANATVEMVLDADPYADQLTRACEVLIRRGRSLGSNAERQRALEYLVRRGYVYELAYEAVRKASPGAA